MYPNPNSCVTNCWNTWEFLTLFGFGFQFFLNSGNSVVRQHIRTKSHFWFCSTGWFSSFTAQKRMFSIKFPADLVTFTEDILNGRLYFLCNDSSQLAEKAFSSACLYLVTLKNCSNIKILWIKPTMFADIVIINHKILWNSFYNMFWWYR